MPNFGTATPLFDTGGAIVTITGVDEPSAILRKTTRELIAVARSRIRQPLSTLKQSNIFLHFFLKPKGQHFLAVFLFALCGRGPEEQVVAALGRVRSEQPTDIIVTTRDERRGCSLPPNLQAMLQVTRNLVKSNYIARKSVEIRLIIRLNGRR